MVMPGICGGSVTVVVVCMEQLEESNGITV